MNAAILAVLFFAVPAFAESVPPGWKALTFRKIPKHTVYTVERSGAAEYIKAVSSGSASGIIQKKEVDLWSSPILTWRWKVDAALKTADARTKKGDDYAARVYVGFKGDYLKRTALNYIWDNKHKTGTILVNPFNSKVKMIVVETGDEKAGRWVVERRNVMDDYLNAFGDDAPDLEFVGIMTDTDQTGESAVAYYGPLEFVPDQPK